MHEAIKTRNAPEPGGHYSQAVRMGNFLFVSGQLPLARDGQMINGTIAEECAQALENIRAIVEAAEATVGDIVQCTVYITDIAHWAEVDGIYGTFFAEVQVLPARAVVPVKELHYDARIEIHAIAFVFGQ
jgi:2-iminobutanoate/2-iminopropanoate deaminase